MSVVRKAEIQSTPSSPWRSSPIRPEAQQAPVADEDHPLQVETVADLVDLGLQGRGIGGVALEDLDRHRAALAVAQEPVDHLELALLAVAGVAEKAPSGQVRPSK